MNDNNSYSETIQGIVAEALRQGADAADAILFDGTSISVSCRLGETEHIERAESRDLGLRVFVGNKQAIVSTSDMSRNVLDALIEQVIAMAGTAPDDPYCGLADKNLLCDTVPADLDLLDNTTLTSEQLADMAKEAEDASLAIQGVSNSEGAGASAGNVGIYLATSDGFVGDYRTSSFSISASVLAGKGTGMERDYDYSSTRHFSDLKSAGDIGRKAGERAVKRLNPKKVKSCHVPILFDPRVAGGLISHFASAINGQSIARKTGFLKDHMGEAVFGSGIEIIDDPLRKRGLVSKPFDGEGVKTGKRTLVENGVLQSWLLDNATANQLDLTTTGHARRGTSSPPSPGSTNLYLAPGSVTPEEMLADIPDGLYVTELIGMGVNPVTGDYSRGASGFWIEKGEIAWPVSEITIAGNLIDMFKNLTPADDLEFLYGTNAPTIRIDGMMVAGS